MGAGDVCTAAFGAADEKSLLNGTRSPALLPRPLREHSHAFRRLVQLRPTAHLLCGESVFSRLDGGAHEQVAQLEAVVVLEPQHLAGVTFVTLR